jgi:hypothetical protein
MKPNNFNSFKLREEFGIANERHFKETICELFQDWGQLNWSNNKYAIFDFENDTISVELKGRTCYSYAYPTTIVGYNKIKEGIKRVKNGKQVFFLFSFKDGLYMWELTLNSWLLIGGKNAISQNIGCPYAHIIMNVEIPMKYLEKVSDKSTIDRCSILG